MDEDNPFVLSHLQKSLLIFLLLAILLTIATLAISWYVWKKWCGADLKRAREERERPQQQQERISLQTSSQQRNGNMLQATSSETLSSLPAYSDLNSTLWRENELRHVEPSAPYLGSFRTNTGNSSLATITTGAEEYPETVTTLSDSQLPSYSTVMRRHE